VLISDLRGGGKKKKKKKRRLHRNDGRRKNTNGEDYEVGNRRYFQPRLDKRIAERTCNNGEEEEKKKKKKKQLSAKSIDIARIVLVLWRTLVLVSRR